MCFENFLKKVMTKFEKHFPLLAKIGNFMAQFVQIISGKVFKNILFILCIIFGQVMSM